jgi:hypothetical protein
MHDCTVSGFTTPCGSGHGCIGAVILRTFLTATQTTFTGANGRGPLCILPTNGGDALYMGAGSSAYLLNCRLVPGLAGCSGGVNGRQIGGPASGNAIVANESSGAVVGVSPVRSGAMASLTVTGRPGSAVWLAISSAREPTFLPLCRGTAHPSPASATVLALGAMPSSGTLPLSFSVPPIGVDAVTLLAQVGFFDTLEGCRVGAPTDVVLLDARF